MSFVGGADIGQVFVQTTSHRAHTPEEIAERALNKLRRADNEDALKYILVKYLREAQDAALADAKRVLIQNGFNDAASRLGD